MSAGDPVSPDMSDPASHIIAILDRLGLALEKMPSPHPWPPDEKHDAARRECLDEVFSILKSSGFGLDFNRPRRQALAYLVQKGADREKAARLCSGAKDILTVLLLGGGTSDPGQLREEIRAVVEGLLDVMAGAGIEPDTEEAVSPKTALAEEGASAGIPPDPAAAPPAKPVPQPAPQPAPTNRGGRPRQSDQKDDQRIVDAWAKGKGDYRNKKDLAREFGRPLRDVKLILDRHRQHERRKRHSS
jgi:hypothetical protein